ncbi:MAG: HAD-IA family hydrolase [Rickettsiales bacterium]|nr:HAD-IA family hydrolase [Rickettsiales bacterium]
MIIYDTHHNISLPNIAIFDWDNTLVDAWEPIHYAIQATLRKFNKPTWPLSETKIRIHRSIRDTIPKYFPEYSIEEVAEAYRTAYKDVQHQITPLDNALKTVELLRTNNVYVAIVSNKQNSILNKEIDDLGWRKFFGVIIGSGDLEQDKPSKITVDEVLKHKSSPVDKIWFIGDSPTDMETAYNSGCLPVLFGNEEYNKSLYAHCKPKLHCHDHQKLLDYLMFMLNNKS